jgi:catechol 2,3-dioxygenase-like lactoylglutathione lyase family enzyme
MKAQPLICVRDVEASSRWYCELLGATSGHGGTHYERVTVGDEFVLQLHQWDDEHPSLGDPAQPHGIGAALWFLVDDFPAAVKRARALHATIVEEPHLNDAANHDEIWIRDPDGYVVVLASAPH